MKYFFSICFLVSGFCGLCATVDTVEVFSSSMQKKIKAVVILPSAYTTAKEYPVIYLLHGFGDTYATWVNNVPSIKEDADTYHFIIVCPDGARSWYFDSPQNASVRYETFIAKELVPWVDQQYKTIKNRKGRGITGLSMGGHGALYLSIKHQDIFAVAGSMSGGVDIRPFPKNWELASVLGTYARQPEEWERHTVMNLLPLLTAGSLALTIECGTGDFFYEVNQKLHHELLYRNIPHDYTIRPGEHNWQYWDNAVHYQFLFMHRFFKNLVKT